MAHAQIFRGTSYNPRQPYDSGNYAGSVGGSFTGYPVGYPGPPPNPRQSYAPSQMGARSHSRNSLARHSRSLGASKASLASQKSGKTSIQQEYHDARVRTNIRSPMYGKGKTPFIISIVLFVVGGLLIIAGGIILLLRFHNNIMLTVDKGEFIGPLLIALGIGAIAGGIKFYYDAYKVSNYERNAIKFSATSERLIAAQSSKSRSYRNPHGEVLMSGTASANAVSRTPRGSLSSLTHV